MTRVLLVLQSYPEHSETYIEVERRQIAERADTLAVVTIRPGTFNPDHMSYERPFSWLSPRVQRRLGLGLSGAAKRYRPDIVHAHWFFMARFARRAARACDVPWTLRTHSFDLLEASKAELSRHTALCNDADCAGVLAFPFARNMLLDAGLREEKIIEALPVVDVERFNDMGPNGPGVVYMGANKEKKNFPDYFRLSNLVPERPFNLYPLAAGWEDLRQLNTDMGTRVSVHDPILHKDMPAVWKQNAWLVYTGSKELASVGWPIAVCEAWASGVGVCVQRIREDLEDYVDGCGHFFEDIEEVPEIIQNDPSPELRKRAHERAQAFDIRRNIGNLYDAWAQVGVRV